MLLPVLLYYANMAADEFIEACQNAIQFSLKSFPSIKELKPIQEEAIINFVKRRDVFAMLPTGYGKSLIFELVPRICQFLHNKGFDYPSDPILIVICPLSALISSHLTELRAHGISACSLSDGNVNIEHLKAGKFSIVLASPEAILDNTTWREMLHTELYQKNVFGIVTDEAHVVPKWCVWNTVLNYCLHFLIILSMLIPNSDHIKILTGFWKIYCKHLL